MFEKASRMKLRFDTPAGKLSVEELWELPLTSATGKANLDSLAIALNNSLKESDTVSFVKKSANSASAALAKLKFDIVLHVIEVRQAESEAESLKRENAAKKDRILEIIASKQDESLKGKSIEELQSLAKTL